MQRHHNLMRKLENSVALYESWNMSFNLDKHEYMKITFKHNTVSYNCTINNAKIKGVVCPYCLCE